MNNAFLTKDVSEGNDPSILSREKVETLTETIEALQNVAGSSYWKVLQKNIFDFDLAKFKREIEKESDEKKIFRLQGKIEVGRKYHLERILAEKRDELTKLRLSLNE